MFAVVVNQPVLDQWLKDFGYDKIEKYHAKELEQFRAEVLKGKVVAFWDDAKDIKLAIGDTLSEFEDRDNLVGWVRGDNAVSGNVAEELARLGKENEELKSRKNDLSNIVLYAGLTYEEYKQFLKNQTIQIDQYKDTLFDFVLKYGRELRGYFNTHSFIITNFLVDEYDMSLSEQIEDLLFSFRLIKNVGENTCTFSEDTNNFYLKALAIQNEENKNQNPSL